MSGRDSTATTIDSREIPALKLLYTSVVMRSWARGVSVACKEDVRSQGMKLIVRPGEIHHKLETSAAERQRTSDGSFGRSRVFLNFAAELPQLP